MVKAGWSPDKDLTKTDHGSVSRRQNGRDQFYEFVNTTFQALVQRESRIIQAKTSLALFCRMDIGILENGDGSIHYFVNEIERTPTTSLWSHDAKKTGVKIGILADTFAEAMNVWLQGMCNSYSLSS